MASPLAEIDWDNLQAADVPIAMRLLMLATQERYIVGTTEWSGGEGGPYKNEYPLYDPFVNSDPKYGRPNDVFANGSNLNVMIDAMALGYRDETRLNEYAAGKVLTTTPASATEIVYLRLNSPADDPVTYANRLFENAGIPGTDGSQYPDLTSGSPLEVKKWYDIITQFKWVERGRYKNGFGNVYESDGPEADVHLNGIFDPSERGLVGERTDNMKSGEDYGTPNAIEFTEAEYQDFKADHDGLWGAYGDHPRNWSQKDFDVIPPDPGLGGGQIPPRSPPELGLVYDFIIRDDRVRIQAHMPQIIYDFSVWRATYGIGLPQDLIQIRQVYSILNSDPSVDIPTPVQPFVEKQMMAPNLTVDKSGGDVWTIVIHNDEVVLPTLPATSAGLSADRFTYQIRFWYSFGTFFNFDAEDGFVYFTPPSP
jgi:hypothetical protein